MFPELDFLLSRRTIGLTEIEPSQWLQRSDNSELELRNKLAKKSDVYMSIDTSVEQEFTIFLSKYLEKYMNRRYNIQSMRSVANIVSEDFCILKRKGDDYIFTSGLVCFPNDWSLKEKIGKPLHAIHTPVPAYVKVSKSVNIYLDKMPINKFYQRWNWGITSTPDFYLKSSNNNTGKIYLRSEKQTFVKMESGNIIFSIHTYIRPIKDNEFEIIRNHMKTMSEETIRYKKLDSKL